MSFKLAEQQKAGRMEHHLKAWLDWVVSAIVTDINVELLMGIVDVQGALNHRSVQAPRLLVAWQEDVHLNKAISCQQVQEVSMSKTKHRRR